jgi:alpha-glucosidase
MSLSGMFNIGHDVGGFAGPPPDPELLIRWTQAGCCIRAF